MLLNPSRCCCVRAFLAGIHYPQTCTLFFARIYHVYLKVAGIDRNYIIHAVLSCDWLFHVWIVAKWLNQCSFTSAVHLTLMRTCWWWHFVETQREKGNLFLCINKGRANSESTWDAIHTTSSVCLEKPHSYFTCIICFTDLIRSVYKHSSFISASKISLSTDFMFTYLREGDWYSDTWQYV